MKLNFSRFAVAAILMMSGAQSQAGSCAAQTADTLYKAMVGNVCPPGAKPTSEGYLQEPDDQKEAMSEFLTVVSMDRAYQRFEQDPTSMDAMFAARAARKAYPGDVQIVQTTWSCSNGTRGKQVQFVGQSCEKVGPTFRYYFKPAPPSLQDMWY